MSHDWREVEYWAARICWERGGLYGKRAWRNHWRRMAIRFLDGVRG